MKPKYQRLILLSAALFLCGAAVMLLLRSLEDYVVYFYSPSDLAEQPPAAEQYIRAGGLVKEGSVVQTAEGTVHFVVTDYAHDMTIHYTGILPGLFREGQGIVAEGHYRDGVIHAKSILAKHDEYYMPPEVAKSLKASGHWKHGEAADESTP